MQIYQSDKKHITDIKFPAFIIKADNETGKWILREGIPELKLINKCTRYLNKNKVFIDVGAHMGTYSIILSRYCKMVYAFEAQRDTYFQLCGNIALNKIKNIEPSPKGVSNEVNLLKFYITTEDGGGSSFIKPENFIRSELGSTIYLDSLNFEGDVGLIKIDVEGYELKVLEGAEKTIEQHQPVILFESNHDDKLRKDILRFFDRIDYTVNQCDEQQNMFFAIPNI